MDAESSQHAFSLRNIAGRCYNKRLFASQDDIGTTRRNTINSCGANTVLYRLYRNGWKYWCNADLQRFRMEKQLVTT